MPRIFSVNGRPRFPLGPRRFYLALLCGALLLASVLSAQAADPPGAPAQPSAPGGPAPATTAPAKAPAARPGNPEVNAITKAFVQTGVLACSGRVNQVANFLTGGAQGVGAFLMVPPSAQDQQLVSVSLEIPAADGPAAYASASFAPNQANGCGAVYETVVWWPSACDQVAGKNFGALKRTGLLAKNITVLDGGVSTKIFLMPAGTGCVSIKKEVIR
jgi:hypothetical protein